MIRLTVIVAIAFAAAPLHAQASGAARASDSSTSAHGHVSAHVIQDASFHRARKVWVYTPPGYDARRKAPYPLVLAFDGDAYRDSMRLPQVLDSLLALGRAPAFVAVLVDNGSGAERIADLGNSTRMPVFIGNQMLPWLRKSWHVTRDPARSIITGSSAGGLGAAFVALSRPDLFGQVFAQSGAFWRGAEGTNAAPYEYLTGRVRGLPPAKVRFILDVGELEDVATLGGAGPNFKDAVRRFRDALTLRGYEVTYIEVPGGRHGEPWWRERLPAGIVALSSKWGP